MKRPDSMVLPVVVVGVFLLLCTGSTLGNESSTRASYGEYCNKTIRCNSREFLTCLNEACHCLKPDGMTFDPEINSCVTLAGEFCRYTVASSSADEDQKSWSEEVRCLTNAKCNSEGVCDCTDNFYEVSNGTCQPKRFQRGECSTDKHCRGDLFFKCDNGLCNCNQDISTYSPSVDSCVGLAEKSCTSGGCVPFSNCDTRQFLPDSGYNYNRYNRNNNPSFNICKCNSGFERSKEGLCLIPHKGICDGITPNCFLSLKCQDGSCVCPYEDYQYYDATLKGCVTLVGGPCGTAQNSSKLSWDAPCVTHSSCSQDEPFKCKCTDGFVPDKDGKCELDFGELCTKNALSCGKLQGLHCTNGKCECKDELQVYDKKISECRGLVGSRCSTDIETSCINGATCQLQRFGGGICICNNGFTLTRMSRTCDEDIPIVSKDKRSLLLDHIANITTTSTTPTALSDPNNTTI